ncbi:type I-E CRISPR-associated protein Cas6/Cse3/CasE [Corynebacterium pseudogenitalium]|uniref:type I-E CRISPR-associated protein Cas6/Cse3/CasE n=1 Tax=Corynebacterium pseudogenitalium TaxID=38303 RepID=UPI00210C9C88|nr:type I-E CRISPR-associated protein Cas6/Cse3/CasE [Corynebacterium pseudogenitalium]MCQ4608670.1 type I-E CRISPR-associated protein Cas6/Cse3/CasE [Corynebacterium pseudogenitalium]
MTNDIPTYARYALTLPSRAAERITKDHGAGHRLLMALLPDGVLDHQSPRQSAHLLWTMAKPTEMLVSSCIPLKQTPDISVADAEHTEPQAGKRYLLQTTVETTYTPATWVPEEIWNLPNRPAIHGKRVPVPNEKLEQWLVQKLERAGFSVTNLNAVRSYRMPIRKRTVPVADITAEVTVADSELALKVYREGLGRSKNFGCGLLQLSPLA